MKRLIAAAAFATAALSAPGAEAQTPLPRLTVGRTERSADCPDAPTLAASVAAQMGREVLDTTLLLPSSEGYDVAITRTESGYSAVVRDTKNAGKARTIDDPGDTCAGLADALALTLSILLDRGNEPPPAPVGVPLAPPPTPPFRAPEAPAGRAFEMGASVLPGGAFAVLGSADFALLGGVDFRLGDRLSLDLGFLFFQTRTIDFPPGEVDVSLLAGRVGACGFVLSSPRDAKAPELGLCGHIALGGLGGAASGYVDSRSETRTWVAVDVGALLQGRIAGPLGYAARAELLIPFTRERFDIAGIAGNAYEAPPLGGLLTAGLRLALP